MPLECNVLSKIIFGPVSIWDEGRGDRIFQPIAHDRPDGDALDENSCVLVTGLIADMLRGAVIAGNEEDASLLREIAEYIEGARTEISKELRPELIKFEMTGYADKAGHFSDEAVTGLKFALQETGIADLPEYKKIVSRFPAP
jgi:hypothetical protein